MNRDNYYQMKYDWYLKTYWENNDETNIHRPNGFTNYPTSVYNAFCEQIDKNGEVIDFGCGNGLMLKHLMNYSGYQLIPYGLDFLEPSIKQAKEIIHPQYKDNFIVKNMVEYSLKDKSFDFIFCPLSHVSPKDRLKFLNEMKGACREKGRIIFYEFPDNLRALELNWSGDLPELRNWKLIQKNYPGILSIAVWENC